MALPKSMKAMKAAKVMKAKRVSKIARGKFARAMVFRGTKERVWRSQELVESQDQENPKEVWRPAGGKW